MDLKRSSSFSGGETNLNINPNNLFAVKVKANWSNYVANFNYTGNAQTWTAPEDGYYRIELWGAQGGDEPNGFNGGLGGYVSGNAEIQKSKNLFIFVGQKGNGRRYTQPSDGWLYGGWNGGGTTHDGSGGGGATDIRLESGDWDSFTSLKSRILVAASGGGADNSTNGIYAGGLVGTSGPIATGGTQTTGGKSGFPGKSENGSFGKGAKSQDGGAAGSGYFGGGGDGSADNSNGGSGSSFISGHNGSVAITEDSTEDNIKQRKDSNGKICTDGTTDITCSYHYSGYKFIDTKMIDGAGYNWTTIKSNYVGQPQPDGSIDAGHNGNGYARITYLGSTL